MKATNESIQTVLPKYYIVKKAVLNFIQSGQLKKDDLIPTEKLLQEQFNVSRITVKRALDELTSEGYLYRLQGRGTFVRNTKSANMPFSRKMISCSDEIRRQDMVPSRKVIAKKIVKADYEIAKNLRIEVGQPVLHFSRIYYADGAPINFSDGYLSLDDLQGLGERNLEGQSLTHILQNDYNLDIEITEGHIEAVMAQGQLPDYLQVEKSFPLLKIHAVSGYMKKGEQKYCETVNSYYRTDSFKITLQD
ncbi:MAG: GntR family transcriptional regulator [Sporolactobacillus sp.]